MQPIILFYFILANFCHFVELCFEPKKKRRKNLNYFFSSANFLFFFQKNFTAVVAKSNFFEKMNTWMKPKWQSSIRRFSQIWLYKPDYKITNFIIILLYSSGATHLLESNIEIWQFFIINFCNSWPISETLQKKIKNHIISNFIFIFNFTFWWKFFQKKFYIKN
jgi:hypothetical protein